MTRLTALRGDTQGPSGARPTLTALVVLTGVFLSSLDHAFDHAWIFMVACSLTAGLILQGIPRKARVRQERVVTCAAEPPAYVLAAGK